MRRNNFCCGMLTWSTRPVHRVEPYEFSGYHIELGYALVHDGKPGTNNLGPRLAIHRKERQHVTNTARQKLEITRLECKE